MNSNNSQYAIGIVGTIISWGLVTRIGRRTLYLNGMLLLLTCLIITGIISVLPLEQRLAGFTVGSLLLIFTLAYNCTVGPITYSLVSELPSTRLKSKTINLARACYLVVGLINGIITPFMLNPLSANWGAKTAWFWAGSAAGCVTYTYFCVPEPKDLTYGQIDELYSENISARNFKAAGQCLRERSLVENINLGDKRDE
jgi:SP family general alpha glucoside:H+ symporter-like MFS transporter